jgi:NADPH:quinone reductase-like Zn-dependent oxidoreductase
MPSHMTYEEAATLPIACGTAWSALYGRTKQVTSGDVVVCMGTGGVSFFTAAVSIGWDFHFGKARRVRSVHGN